MEKKYLNESRYKKGTVRKRRDSTTVKSNLNTTSQQKQITTKTSKNGKKIKKVRNKGRKIEKQNKVNNKVICIILLIIIAIISRLIIKDEDEPFISFPFLKQANVEVIKIGVITEQSLLKSDNKNCVINELNKYSKDMLLEINEDYSITYKCISKVTKISNREYVLARNTQSNVTIDSIKQTLSEYMLDNESVYYSKLDNIFSMEIVDSNTLNIKLKTDMPYFIYNLDICLKSSKDITNYTIDNSSTTDKLVLIRHKDADKELPAKVIIINYKDMYAAAQAYKEKEINMFATDAENVENILGKYEYNVKKFRNGETVFLFSNPNSKLYSNLEVRKAIAYSIDRDSIIQDILKSKGEKIDLPYIYDNVKYKYDIYAAENLLLTTGYNKVNNVYTITENGVKIRLELTLIVNKSDQVKVDIANRIKNNLNAIGIKINVETLNEDKLQDRINKGNYDLVLASVNLNNIPDLSFVNKNLFMNDKAKQLVQNINNSAVERLNSNIEVLQDELSENISAVGLYSDVSYLIYSKDIIGIENISYMNIFKSILR